MMGFFVVAFTFEAVFPLACTGGLCDLSHRGLPGASHFRRPCNVRVRTEGMSFTPFCRTACLSEWAAARPG